jgi:hypothetical protein
MVLTVHLTPYTLWSAMCFPPGSHGSEITGILGSMYREYITGEQFLVTVSNNVAIFLMSGNQELPEKYNLFEIYGLIPPRKSPDDRWNENCSCHG